MRWKGLSAFMLLVCGVVCEPGRESTTRNAPANVTDTQVSPTACPTVMGDVVISFLSALLSNIGGFRAVELPPFLRTRVLGSQGNLLVRQYIEAQFRALGWLVEEDISVQTTPLGPVQFVNVIATQNPAARARIVLACHYDSKLTPTGFIGAMDSAVPCAMMIDLAKKLTFILQFLSSDVTLQMIFFDGEEALVRWTATDSLYGSRHLANVWQNTLDRNDPTKNNLANIAAFILLDLIGHPSTKFQRFFPETDYLYTQLVQFESCLRARGLLVRPANSRIFHQSRRLFNIEDDHVPFQRRGVGIMHLITAPFPLTWHTLYDNESTMDYTVIDDLNRILRVFITNLAITGVISSNP